MSRTMFSGGSGELVVAFSRGQSPPTALLVSHEPPSSTFKGVSGSSDGKESAAMQETWGYSLSQEVKPATMVTFLSLTWALRPICL